MALPGIQSTDYNPYTRFKGPVLSGQIQDGAVTPPPGGIMLVQSTAALLTQIVTTTQQTAKAAYVYITQGTLAVSSSTNTAIAAAPPYTGAGAALYFDGTRKKLSVFSTIVGDWVSVTLSSS